MDIQVVFADADGPFARAELLSETLPDRFDGTQYIELQGSQYHVVEAEPANRADYEAAGLLVLRLWRTGEPETTDTANPLDVKMSMSSLCDALPACEPASGSGPVLQVKDDLWRDVELVGPGHEDHIAECFEGITRVVTECADGIGFSELYIRREPRTPLDGITLGLTEVTGVFSGTSHYITPVVIPTEGMVTRGFALPLATGAHMYGTVDNGRLSIAGIHRTHAVSDLAVVGSLAELIARHSLSLVDWRSRLRLREAEDLAAYFATEPQMLWR
jgi:hypothetical protein